MTTNWYWRRIRKNLDRIVRAYGAVLPANRAAVSKCLRLSIWDALDRVLVGLRDADAWDSIDWEEDKVFSKFKDYVLDEERKLKTILRRLSYYIDEDNTLHTVLGRGRPEKVHLN